MKPLLRPEELATMLGVAKGTVYLWAKQGILPSLTLQKCVRFRREEIEDWLRERERGASGTAKGV
jgi:excisionase family DNA binding protein